MYHLPRCSGTSTWCSGTSKWYSVKFICGAVVHLYAVQPVQRWPKNCTGPFVVLASCTWVDWRSEFKSH